MKQYCIYHPTRVAHWNCPKCNQHFCPECIDKRPKAGYAKNEFMHFCPKCNVEVDWVGIANILEPFWTRLPKIFAYPFSAGPLTLMAVVTILCMTAFSLLMGHGSVLFSVLVMIAIWGVLFKYSFAALKETANGNLRPPKITTEVLTEDFGEVFKQLILFFVIGFVTGFVSAMLGQWAGNLLTLFFQISLPAMIILLVTTNQLSHALNPALFIGLMKRIGWGYLILCLFLLLLSWAPVTVMFFIMPLIPMKLSLFVTILSVCYYTVVSYHLMGYVVLQYHEQIGYAVEFKEFDDPTEKIEVAEIHDPEEMVLRDVTQMVQEGDLDKAIDEIQNFQRNNGVIKNKSLADRYYELLKMKNHIDEILRFAGIYLDLIVKANDKKAGIKVYSHCKSIDPEFEPSSDALMKIAGWVGDGGKPESSIKLLNQIIKKYPSDPVTPRAYFRAAQIFHDRMMKPEKSKEIIHTLIKKYPDSDVIPMAKRYLEGI